MGTSILCFLITTLALVAVSTVGLDIVRLWPFAGGFFFSAGFLVPTSAEAVDTSFCSTSSNTAFKKSGSPKSSDSCFLSEAAPSRSAWLVFSTAFLSPISYHFAVTWSFSRNLPGGSNERTASTMEREIFIFCFFVLVT
jgi:hypothetical protein